MISGLLLAGAYLWHLSLDQAHTKAWLQTPDFTSIAIGAERKQAFIDYLYPVVAAENLVILKQRETLLDTQQRLHVTGEINAEQHMWLQRMARYYVSAYAAKQLPATIDELLSKVDVIPPSLVLAQAANETAWGGSRFAAEANNYFGQWCYRSGCGLVPLQRESHLSHEVQRFASARDSVRAYLHLLNSGKAFEKFRALRRDYRQEKLLPPGTELAAGLSKYSARGSDYIDSIRQIISANNLKDYSDAFYAAIEDNPQARQGDAD